MVSTKAVRQGLYEKLNVSGVTSLLASGSASLFHAVAPPSAQAPYVIFNQQAGTPRLRMGGQAYKDHVWLIKAVARAKDRPAASIAEDIDKAINDALDFSTLTISGGVNLFSARESDVSYTETDGDQVYSHQGALYRISVDDAA